MSKGPELPSFLQHPENATRWVTIDDLIWLLDRRWITPEGARHLCPSSALGVLDDYLVRYKA